MPESSLRQLQILQILPRHPSKINTSQIQGQLNDLGYAVSLRMIQRDLESLESVMPIVCDDRERPFGWSWHQSAFGLQPSMDPIEALTFSLAEQYLEPLMPSKSFRRIKVFFDRANSILKKIKKNEISRWRERVRVEHQWQRLEAPKINDKVEAEIYDALLKGRQLTVLYTNRGLKKAKVRIINPLGLVLRGQIHYLICSMDEDKDNPRFLPLHRFTKAEWNGETSHEPKGFSVDKYIKDNNLGYLYSNIPIVLEAIFERSAGFHLTESSLSKDQEIKILDEDKILIKATVSDTAQLRWWLLGFGSQVEVIKPEALREEMIHSIKSMVKVYR
ncbi:WYL domain-containing protein [Gammaproteobacteria bacterium]|nr:WYL domain-containing protein [Gammaproteobacteria bacterium]